MLTSNTTKTKEEKKLIKAVSAIFLHTSDNFLHTVSLFLIFPFPRTISRFCCHVTNTKSMEKLEKIHLLQKLGTDSKQLETQHLFSNL